MEPKTIDTNTVASHPGRVTLSHKKLRLLHPELYSPFKWFWHLRTYSAVYPAKERSFWFTFIEEHLIYGDSRAAVVSSTSPLLVAAYTDEIDCVAMLQFDDGFARGYSLEVGSRLLTVNTYAGLEEGYEPDLKPGPGSYGRYGNFAPYIADFLTEDVRRVRERKSEIDVSEWERAEELGKEYLSERGRAGRDGRPLRCLFARDRSPFVS